MEPNLNDVVGNVNEIAYTIDELGIYVTIAAVMIVAFMGIMIFMMYNMKKQSNNTINQNNAMIENLRTQNEKFMESILNRIQGNLNHDHRNDMIRYMETAGISKVMCKHIVDKANADRAIVYIFHNGTKSLDGLPFFKMTPISEWTKRRFVSSSNHNSTIPLYTISKYIDNICNNGYCEFDGILKNNLEVPDIISRGIDYARICGIFDIDHNIVGLLIVEYILRDNIHEKEIFDLRLENTLIILRDIIGMNENLVTDIEERIKNV